MQLSIENKESIPIVETVRVALAHRGKFLTLQKTADSKNPGALEFPGGKVFEEENLNQRISTEEEQKEAAIAEVGQETGILITKEMLEKKDEFDIYFEANGKRFKRRVHLFLVRLPDDKDFEVLVNQTENAEGQSEDKHEKYIWKSPEELIKATRELGENNAYPLARNSRHLKAILS